jgi:uncharacterized iron-regulated membrane protein
VKVKIRPLLVLWHRWFGLFGAIWLLAMAVTGVILVFYSELDQALNADLYFVEPQGARLPVSTWIESAESARPNSYVKILHLPDGTDSAAVLQLSPQPGSMLDHGHPSQLFVDPYTAIVLGERELGELSLDRRNIMNVFYGLHMDLLLGETMFLFLGLIAFLWIIDHVVSLLLSFPTLSKWKQSFRVRFSKGGYKRLFDLHRAGGVWLFPITLMFAVSSLYFIWYGPVVKLVDSVSPITPRHIFLMPNQEQAQIDTPIDMAAAHHIAKQVGGGANVDMMRFFPRKNAYELRLFDPRDIDPHGRRMMVIDAFKGEVLSDRHITEGGAGNQFMAWQYPLHSGKGFGWPGRLLIFFSGLMLIVVLVTGVKIWLRKRIPHRKIAP